jgi:hypothetical protein
MKAKYLLARSVSDASLDVPVDALDLPRWTFALSDLEYQQCARGHFGTGGGKLPDGRRTSINVESAGGHLAVSHYVEEVAERDHLKLVSERSDVWIFHLIHVHPTITWEMRLIPTSARSCSLRVEVSLEHPSLLLKVASALCLVPFFVKRHDAEETPHFAASLARTASPATRQGGAHTG